MVAILVFDPPRIVGPTRAPLFAVRCQRDVRRPGFGRASSAWKHAAIRTPFERAVSAPPVPSGLPLVIALTGFTDAGSAVSGLVDHLRDELDPTPLAVFCNDVLLDYRARRPVISFDQDHLTDYRPPRLELSLAHDAVGQPFLILAGYEPDFAWDGFAAVVRDFASSLARVDGDLGARDPHAGAAHEADRHHRQRNAQGPH